MQMDVGILLVIGDSGGPQIIPGTKRLVQKSEGIHFTVVNGKVIYEHGRLSGDLPGQVLRGSGRSMRQAAAA